MALAGSAGARNPPSVPRDSGRHTTNPRPPGRDGIAGRSRHCAACGAPVDEAWCRSCGLELGGQEADALRDLKSRLAAADAELNIVWARRDDLAKELASRRWQRLNVASGPVFPSAPTPGRPSSAPTVGEWN